MFTFLMSLVGATLLLFTLFDFVRTTLQLEGGGPITNFIGASIYRAALSLKSLPLAKPILMSVGVIVLLTTISTWILLLWAGWFLLFLPHEAPVISSSTSNPADFWALAYFVGYSLVTLGIGDYVPNGPRFQVLTVLASFNGFFFMTLSVTYLIPVVSALAKSRELAFRIFTLGRDPVELVCGNWEDGTVSAFARSTEGLIASIALRAQQYFAYPVLQYFPAPKRMNSPAVAIVILDEALTLILCAVADGRNLPVASLRQLRRAIDNYLSALGSSFLEPSTDPVPMPDLKPLAECGIATVEPELFRQRVQELSPRRRLLRSLLEKENRRWEDVYPSREVSTPGEGGTGR